MWVQLILLGLLFSVISAAAIILFGKSLGSVGGFDLGSLFGLLKNLYFLSACVFAFSGRVVFMYIIKAVSQIPRFANAPTTIANFFVILSYIFIVFGTWIFLGESLTVSQIIGIMIISIGVLIMGSGVGM